MPDVYDGGVLRMNALCMNACAHMRAQENTFYSKRTLSISIARCLVYECLCAYACVFICIFFFFPRFFLYFSCV